MLSNRISTACLSSSTRSVTLITFKLDNMTFDCNSYSPVPWLRRSIKHRALIFMRIRGLHSITNSAASKKRKDAQSPDSRPDVELSRSRRGRISLRDFCISESVTRRYRAFVSRTKTRKVFAGVLMAPRPPQTHLEFLREGIHSRSSSTILHS
jgi:hypothetical protein